ncbi:MAG: hypothetical protein HUU06_13545, partial [Planctomycetaceae bacterium]|nr:hypothetical protein [Planctomycetaceae bacterium]
FSGGVMGIRPQEEGEPVRDLEVLVPALPEPLASLLADPGPEPGAGGWESPLAPDDIPRA